jgi:hypothetical protein
MDYYYFEVLIDSESVHVEIFTANSENATKYIAYKEQLIRENVNYLRPENNPLLVTSKYYKNQKDLHSVTSEEVSGMEKVLKDLSELRCKLFETFRKVKDFVSGTGTVPITIPIPIEISTKTINTNTDPELIINNE